jgi:hypothetical protein
MAVCEGFHKHSLILKIKINKNNGATTSVPTTLSVTTAQHSSQKMRRSAQTTPSVIMLNRVFIGMLSVIRLSVVVVIVVAPP